MNWMMQQDSSINYKLSANPSLKYFSKCNGQRIIGVIVNAEAFFLVYLV